MPSPRSFSPASSASKFGPPISGSAPARIALRIRDAGFDQKSANGGQVFPIHADAHALPFAGEFFDAILAVDCYSYFGTDSLYFNYLAHFAKPRAQIGIVGAGLAQEMSLPIPEHLRAWWSSDMWCLHSADWWREHWQRTELVDIEIADDLPDSWEFWSNWHRTWWSHNTVEIEAVEADTTLAVTAAVLAGAHIVRVHRVAEMVRRRAGRRRH